MRIRIGSSNGESCEKDEPSSNIKGDLMTQLIPYQLLEQMNQLLTYLLTHSLTRSHTH